MIAYIESPFQLICAIEFSKKHKIEKLFVRKSKPNNDQQINYLINLYSDLDFEIIYLPKISARVSFIWFLFLLKNFHKKTLFGNYKSRVSFFFLNKILSDDGTGSLSILNEKGYDSWTFFDIEKKKKHSFDYFKTYFKTGEIKSSDAIYFLGQKLIEECLITENEYFLILKRITSKFSNYKITYFAHREEQKYNLDKIEKLGFLVKNINYPIELEPVVSGFKPKHVYGFFSTGLLSLNEIYNINFSYYELESLYSEEYSKKNNYFEIYKYLEKKGKKLNL